MTCRKYLRSNSNFTDLSSAFYTPQFMDGMGLISSSVYKRAASYQRIAPSTIIHMCGGVVPSEFDLVLMRGTRWSMRQRHHKGHHRLTDKGVSEEFLERAIKRASSRLGIVTCYEDVEAYYGKLIVDIVCDRYSDIPYTPDWLDYREEGKPTFFEYPERNKYSDKMTIFVKGKKYRILKDRFKMLETAKKLALKINRLP